MSGSGGDQTDLLATGVLLGLNNLLCTLLGALLAHLFL